MAIQEVNAKTRESDRVVSVQYDFGDNVAEAIELFGEEVIFSRYCGAAVIDLQSLLRRGIKGEKTDEEIRAIVSEWKPGVKSVVRKSAQEKIKDAFSSMSAEDKQAMLEALATQLEDEAA